MKKFNSIIFYTLVFLFAGIFHAQAQQTEDLDELQVDKVAIVKGQGKTSGPKFLITGKPASLVTAFGKPQSKTIEFAEMDQLNFTVYRYNGGEFSFYEDKLYYFRITGSGFQVLAPLPTDSTKNYSFKVGDSIHQTKDVYSKSYKARNSDGVVFFLLYQLIPKKNSKKFKKEVLEPGFGLFSNNGIITDLIFEE